MSTLTVLVIIAQIHQVINVPLSNDKPGQTVKITSSLPPNAITSHGNDKVVPVNGNVPVLVPLFQTHHVMFVEQKSASFRKQKSPNIPLSLPIPHHLLAPTTLHVIPIHTNFHQTAIHQSINHNHILSNNKLPIVSHTYSHNGQNITHPTQLIPILIPLHTHLVPLHDLTVIPLHRQVQHVEPKFSQYRVSMGKKDPDEEEPINRFRSFYGGFGNGLYIGGHGAGHGFYAGYG